jgi:hypothetical protein
LHLPHQIGIAIIHQYDRVEALDELELVVGVPNQLRVFSAVDAEDALSYLVLDLNWKVLFYVVFHSLKMKFEFGGHVLYFLHSHVRLVVLWDVLALRNFK